MRLGVAILLLVLFCAVAVYVAFKACRWLWRRRRPWSMLEVSDGQRVALYATKPDSARLLIAAVSFEAEDFDSQIYEARAQAKMKIYALNAARRGS